MRLRRRLARASFRTLAWSTLVVAVGVWALLRTAVGHQVILNWLVDQVDGRVAGRVVVDELHSGGIFHGARLLGVELRTPTGEVFFTADSLEVSYDLLGLVRGQLAFRNVRVWGADVELAWREGVEGSTLGRWMAPQRPPPAPRPGDESGGEDVLPARAAAGPVVRLEDVRVEGSVFRLRRPTGLDPAGMLRVLPEGGGTLALDLELDQLRVPEVVVAPNAAGGIVVEVEHARGRLHLLRESLPFRDFAADVRVADGRVEGRVSRLDVPQGSARGTVAVMLRPEARNLVEVELQVSELDGLALAEIVPAVAPVRGRATLRGAVARGGGSRWTLTEGDARWGRARLRATGTLAFRNGTRLEGLEVQADSLPVATLARYAPALAGRPGTLSGNLRLDGALERLGVVGRVGHRSEAGELTAATVSGVLVRSAAGWGVQDGDLLVSPLDYPSLDPWIPGLPVAGRGSARVRLNGAPARGLRIDLDLTHRTGPAGGDVSRVLAQGSVRLDPAGWRVDVQGDAAPLRLEAFRDRYPQLPIEGEVSGGFRVSGGADSLSLRVETRGAPGVLSASGTFDPSDLTRPARVEGALAGFRPGAFVPRAGERTLLNGTFRAALEGRGDAMVGSAFVRLADSNVRGVRVDSVVVRTLLRDGALELDTARASVGGLEMDGGGRLGLPGAEGARGTMALHFRADSLMGLRPAFLGDVVHARDTLRALDREILLLSGVNPDTLPLRSEVTLTGQVEGDLTLEGWLDDFRGSARTRVTGLGFADAYLHAATLELEGRNLPGEAALLLVALDTDSLRALGRELASTRVRATLTRTGARATAELVRSDVESYTLAGGLAREDGRVRLDLDQADLQFDSLLFSLSAPARVTWSDSVVAVDALELVRSGPGNVRLSLEGQLPQRGDADFRARASGLRLERIMRLLQIEEPELAGALDLDVAVRGTAAAPQISGTIRLGEARFGSLTADSVRTGVEYAARSARVNATVWQEGREVLDGRGAIPVDLSLRRGTDRLLDRAMEVAVRLDSMAVAPLLSIVEDFEDVQGTVSGDFTVRGTLEDPVPEGVITLTGGAWTVGALGVRQRDVNGTFTLAPDGTVTVDARARAGGTLDVTGNVSLTPLTNPGLALALQFRGFQGVDRRDVVGALSGTLRLDGTYNLPRITGELTVDRGTLFLEEFQRAVGVVDLTDPLFLGLVERESLAIQVDRPLLAGIRNPFMDALRVEVDLSVPRDTWLRSGDMNVEISGDLDVAYDRPQRDLVLVGELLARRGQYSVLGRTFEVRGGTVSFIGIPGINPILDIQAVAPIRRQEGGRLEIQASVQGSLVDPQVTLSSEETGLVQSDLVSYLIFGRPSSDITAGAGGSSGQLTSTAGATLASAGLGTLATQLGSLAAQEATFIDYLSVSQVGDLGLTGGGGVANSFSSTQVEVGWYFGGGNVFGVLVLRPLSGLGGTSTSPIAGARLEWQASDQYHVEAFVEDQFLRRGSFGLTDLGIGQSYSLGIAIFREWGY
ncbi:MAG: translocation/assembly module TamB domain-containing protein [Longimicrobiales bacterium]|nr:translocation/assembly module TamB domain-containing protein [Longimicrobiales bacterium]